MDSSTGEGQSRPQIGDRAQISEKYKWNLDHIYSNWDDWKADLDRLRGFMDQYQEFKGTLSQGPTRLLEALRLSDQFGMLSYRVYQYPSLMLAQDTRDNAVQAKVEQANIVLVQFQQATAWFTPELLEIPESKVLEWFASCDELAPYRFRVTETYRRQQHTLDEAGERLLAYAGSFNETPAHTHSMLSDADVEYPTVRMASGEEVVATCANFIHGLYTRRDQADREALFAGHFSVLNSHCNTYAAIYNGVLQRDWFVTQARKYGSTLAAELDQNNIPSEVVENLITTAKAGAGPLQRYHRLRKQALGLERYHYFDAFLPLVEIDWALPYSKVKPLVIDSVELFGSEYKRTVERAFAERWIDVYENDGKRSGAFSASVYGVHPFMLLNYADTLADVFTVAHEMGHTLHTMLSQESQPFATSAYTIFVAEVASMTNEDLFLAQLLASESDPRRRVALLQHAIDEIAAGFYRQTMFAEFELAAHRAVERGEPITASKLQEEYLRVINEYFADSLDDQERFENGWARIPHFFSTPYYVYQYATSKAAAALLHSRMTSGGPEQRIAVERHLELLRSGGNDHPIAQLRKAGVDLSTTEPIEALVATMDRLVTELEEELLAVSS